MVLIGKVDHFLDSRLDYCLSTLVAGKKSNVNRRAEKILSACVKYCVQLRVNYVLILGVSLCFISVPWELVVRATLRKSVIAGRQYSLAAVNDAGANPGVRVFGSLGGKERDSIKYSSQDM